MNKVDPHNQEPGILAKILYLLTPEEKRSLRVLTALVFLAGIIEVVGVSSVLPFISLVSDPSAMETNPYLNWVYHFLGFTSPSSFLIAAGLLILGLISASNLFTLYSKWYSNRFVWLRNHRISSSLLAKYLEQSYQFFLDKNSAEQIKNILAEVQLFVGNFLLPLIDVFSRSLVTFMIIALLVYVEPVLALAVTAIVGVSYLSVYHTFKSKLKSYGAERIAVDTERFKCVADVFGGIKDIKALNIEPYYRNIFEGPSRRFAEVNAIQATLGIAPRYLVEIVVFGLLIVSVLVLLVVEDGLKEALPLLGLYVVAGYRIMPNVQLIYSSIAKVQYYRSTLDLLYSIAKKNEQILALADNVDPGTAVKGKAKHIDFDNVSFSYSEKDDPILENANFRFDSGRKIGIVGASGVGKSTLVDVMLTLLEPTSGQIKINGVNIDRNNVSEWKSRVGYASQITYLADSTIAQNIALGVPAEDIDMERVEAVGRIAQLAEFVAEMDLGYLSQVGERGVKLSGGQRQRIGVARALYRDPEVLVLDEATSALDDSTEAKLMDSLNQHTQGKMVLMIAHRISSLSHCDEIVALHERKLVSRGTYKEFLSRADLEDYLYDDNVS